MSRFSLPGIIISLTAILMVSGCATNTTNTGKGVVIQEFTPGFSEVYPGEEVHFFLKFKNEGSVKATKVFAELVGLDEDWAASSSGLGTITSGEMLPQEAGCQYTSSSKLTLNAPDLTYGTGGESATCTWRYNAPNIPGGTKTKYDITARVFYNYNTFVTKSFTIAPAQELMAYNQQGRTLPASTISTTNSPISITAVARDPIRFYTDDMVSFPLAITLSNNGGGVVCLKDMCKKGSDGGNEWNKVVLRIKPRNSDVKISPECSKYTGSTGDSSGGGSETKGVVEVWPNRDNTVICDIKVTGLSKIVGHQEMLIDIGAEYSYFTDKDASITIL